MSSNVFEISLDVPDTEKITGYFGISISTLLPSCKTYPESSLEIRPGDFCKKVLIERPN